MDKVAAVAKYLSSKPCPKYFKRNVCYEVKCAIEAWEMDKFAPDTKELNALDDSAFVDMYEKDFKDTVQHELAEAIEHIWRFEDAHGTDIFEYLKRLEKYRMIKGQVYINVIPEVSKTIVVAY
jgi:hypothetical protein